MREKIKKLISIAEGENWRIQEDGSCGLSFLGTHSRSFIRIYFDWVTTQSGRIPLEDDEMAIVAKIFEKRKEMTANGCALANTQLDDFLKQYED